jgi:hypothetical protein
MNISRIDAQEKESLLYTDISVDWHKWYIQNAQSLGLFDPWIDNNLFDPESWVKREDMVDLIQKLIELYK